MADNQQNTYLVKLQRRFCAKIKFGSPQDCWEWDAVRAPNGYGMFRLPHTYIGAHRMSYEIFVGKIPDGLQVLHHCDNKPCVNPHHLFLGTGGDNMIDKSQKGRASRFPGEDNPANKFPKEVIDYIRNSKEKGAVLAKRFNMSHQHVSDIRLGKRWAWCF